jgi:hypothetical protein
MTHPLRTFLTGFTAVLAAGATVAACSNSPHHGSATRSTSSKSTTKGGSPTSSSPSGTGSSPVTAHPTPSSAQFGRAAAINLAQADFPAGWEGHPASGNVTNQSTLQRCGTAPAASVTAPALSSAWVYLPKPTLGKSGPSTGEPLEALSGVSFAPDTADASSYISYSRSAAATACVTKAIAAILASSSGAASSAPSLKATTSTTSIDGTSVTLIRVTVAGTTSAPNFLLAYFAKGTVLVSAELVDFTAAQQTLQNTLLTGLVRRA